MPSKLWRDVEKLDTQRARARAYCQGIVDEQMSIVDSANRQIEKINVDIRALRFRLDPYVERASFTEGYYKLKERYEELIQQRDVLEKTRVIAEESAEYAKVNMVPGEMAEETGREGNL